MFRCSGAAAGVGAVENSERYLTVEPQRVTITRVRGRGVLLYIKILVALQIRGTCCYGERHTSLLGRGFGSFEIRHYKAYEGRNPRTGAKVQVRPKRLPFFKVGKELKERVNNGRLQDNGDRAAGYQPQQFGTEGARQEAPSAAAEEPKTTPPPSDPSDGQPPLF